MSVSAFLSHIGVAVPRPALQVPQLASGNLFYTPSKEAFEDNKRGSQVPAGHFRQCNLFGEHVAQRDKLLMGVKVEVLLYQRVALLPQLDDCWHVSQER